MVETVAPTGYNLLAAPIVIVITPTENAAGTTVTYAATFDGTNAPVTNGTVNLAAAQATAQPVADGDVLNQAGAVLPSTGGIGTTIFYILGGLLVVGAAVILVARRKASN